jgi:methyl-accepting chemotaxis protein
VIRPSRSRTDAIARFLHGSGQVVQTLARQMDEADDTIAGSRQAMERLRGRV